MDYQLRFRDKACGNLLWLVIQHGLQGSEVYSLKYRRQTILSYFVEVAMAICPIIVHFIT